MLYVTRYLLYVIYYMLMATCYMVHVKCYMLLDICYMLYVIRYMLSKAAPTARHSAWEHQQSIKNHWKIIQKSIKNQRKIHQKSTKNLLKSRLRPQEAPRPPQELPKPFQAQKQEHFHHPPGSLLGGFSGHVGFQEPLKGHSKEYKILNNLEVHL